jgi:hypothetical protein
MFLIKLNKILINKKEISSIFEPFKVKISSFNKKLLSKDETKIKIQSDFYIYKNLIVEMLNMYSKMFKQEDKISEAIIESGISLMESYMKFIPLSVNINNTKLTCIVLACFWISKKFLDDEEIFGKDLEYISGIPYILIVNEESKILHVLNFRICCHMSGEKPSIKII